MNFKNLKIGIWGYGREGKSAYDFVTQAGGFRSLDILLDEADESLPLALPVISGTAALDKIKGGGYDVIIKSPGISLYRAEIIAAKEKGTKFSSVANLWFAQSPKTKIIVVTGTKGKSTCVSLLYHILKTSGLDVVLGGNIGKSLLDLPPADYTILELSSYQLADLDYTPDLFVVLNLFPEHMQWHGSHAQYYQDKLHLLSLDTPPRTLANAQNLKLKTMIGDKPDIEWFNTPDTLHGDAGLLYNGAARLDVTCPLRGAHNTHNIAAALHIATTLHIPLESAIQSLKNFTPLPHRLQEFTLPSGIIAVNDSISTTPETAMAALEVYKYKPLFLILGGTDRGQDYGALIESLKNYTLKGIATLPANGVRIAQALQGKGIPVFEAADLPAAVAHAKEVCVEGDVILLSPAAPSYGEFKNFEERGAQFLALLGHSLA